MHGMVIVSSRTTAFVFLLIISFLVSGMAAASGSFVPSGAGPGKANYNSGKAIVMGRKGDANCRSCHAKFKRSALKALPTKVSEQVVNCDVHTPCFATTLSPEELRSLDAYFTKRYRLK